MKKNISLLSLLLYVMLLVPSAYSQDFENQNLNRLGCATPSMTKQQREYTLNVVDKVASSRKVSAKRNNGTTCLPIRIHRVTLDNGTGGIAMGDVNEGVANLNNFYLEAGIEFYIASVNTITSSEYYNFVSSDDEADMTSENSIYDAVNVYFVGDVTGSSGQSFCGYAYYPADATYSLNILMDNDCLLNGPNGTFVHEFGHFFNLAHTHQDTENGNTDAYAENVSRAGANANCDTNGDMLCDTPADPNGSNDASCNFINDGIDTTDINGLTYAPDINNIMSYYSDACGGIFTPEQYTRIANGLATRLAHTNYNLGASPNAVTNPSGLIATPNNSYGIDLAWTDNATNELGYIIERSSDGGGTWVSLLGGGVNTDITFFTDTTISSNTSYKYRIKASNDDCNDYSNEASVVTGLLNCLPSHQSNSCNPNGDGLGVAIYNLQLDGDGTGDISNLNNGCTGPLSIFNSTHSANVTAGNNYSVIGDFIKGSQAYNQYITIWMDVNQDGDFDDTNEKIYQATVAQTSFIAPITIPATAVNGFSTMRIRSGWEGGGQVTSPCGYWALGEAEDYTFIVSGGALTDTTPPVFENSTPSESSVTQTSFTLVTDINEAGIIYYVVVADGASAPTSAEVKSGTGNGGVGQIDSGNAVVIDGDFSNNFSVTSLFSETAYDIYVVAEDDNGTPNLQVSPVKIDVTTLAFPAPTITFANINSTYGDANFNLGATSDSEGTIIYSIEGANTTGTSLSGINNETVTLGNAGSIIIRATQAANGGFSSGTQDITLTIGTAALTVTADSGFSKVYGSTDPTLTYTITGFQGADNEASLDTGVSISRAAGENVAAYVVTPSAAADTNYDVSFATSTFAITQAALTVTADSGLSKVYGGTDPTLTYTIIGFQGADNEASLDTGVSISRATGEIVGTYTITPSGAADTNYNVSFVTSTFAITQAALTVTADSGFSKVYGSTDPTLTYTITGFQGADNEASLDTGVSISRAAGENVAAYVVTPSAAADTNYNVSFVTSTFAITQAALTVTADSGLSKVYGATDPTLTYTITGFQGADNEASLDTGVSISRAAGEIVGTYTITPSGAADTNYNVSFVTSTFAITQAALTVTADSGFSKVYGSTDPTLTYTITGFQGADNEASLDTGVSISRAAGENVAAYVVTPSAAADTNYDVSFATSTFAITQAALTVTADSGLSKVYGSTDPTLTYTITGFQGADNEASLDTGVSISRAAGENVAAYVVTPSAAADTNYNVSFVTSTFAITQAALTVTADSGFSKVYGSTDPTLTYTITGFQGADNEASLDTGVSISRAAGEIVGTYTITPSGAADTNYIISFITSDFSITLDTLTITGLTGDNKVYDGTTEATASGTPVLSGVQTGDIVRLDGTAVFTFATADIGTEITIITIGYTISGVDSGNYSLTQPILSADITAILSLDDISLIDLVKIYPNPALNELYIKTNSIQLEQVIVYDVLGKSIINTKLNLDKIDVSTLKVGVYLLKIKTDQGTVVRRIIKK